MLKNSPRHSCKALCGSHNFLLFRIIYCIGTLSRHSLDFI
jgi:hypothetical protein